MIWQTNKPKYLSSVLIEAGSITKGTVTADLICVDNQTVIATGLVLTEIDSSGCYQILIDEETYTINRQYYKAIIYYDGDAELVQDIELETFSPNKIANNSMVGIIEDTQTLAGVVEL